MDISKFTIKELEQLFKPGQGNQVTDELLAACRNDGRAAAKKIVQRYERQQVRLAEERQRLLAMYQYEDEGRQKGFEVIAGVDEAGRGPLAGPVSVAAVILPERLLLPHLNDSKKLSPKVREELCEEIVAKAVAFRQVFVEPEVIDRRNILQATIQGMYDAIFGLPREPQLVLIDAVHLKELNIPQLSLIKGDARSASIAAASIIAKVARDRLMDEYDKRYPQYGFASHKGYGTAEHVAAIRKYGLCPIHRLTFEPVRSIAAGR